MKALSLLARLPWRFRVLAGWWGLCAALPVVGITRALLVNAEPPPHSAVAALGSLMLAVLGLLLAVPPRDLSPANYFPQLRREVERLSPSSHAPSQEHPS